MTSIRHILAILALLAAAPLSAGALTVTGPSFPPDGGTVDFAFSGAGAADAGGANFEFTNFVQTTGWIELYWGPSSAFLPTGATTGPARRSWRIWE